MVLGVARKVTRDCVSLRLASTYFCWPVRLGLLSYSKHPIPFRIKFPGALDTSALPQQVRFLSVRIAVDVFGLNVLPQRRREVQIHFDVIRL